MAETRKIAEIADLVPDAENARSHNPRNVGMIVDSLHEVGAARSIVIDEDGNILAGNATVEAAAEAGIHKVRVVDADGETIVAVRRSGLSAEQKRRLSYFDNRTAELASWDLDQVLADVEKGMDFDGLFYEDELQELLAGLLEDEPAEDPGAQMNRAAELQDKWGTELGQYWILGDHRLVIGDCTDKAVVDAVMRRERPDMVWTDPPFNVSYQSNESIESLKARHRRTNGLVIDGDSISDVQFDSFLDVVLASLPLKDGGAFYLCAPAGRTQGQFRNALDRANKLALRQCIVWVKNQFVFGRQDYHWGHESILCGWADGKPHYFVDDRTQDTVWEIDRPRQSPHHPTMKPVELAERAIRNSSRETEIVFDGFVGSGTTIIACERLNRRCRAIDIDTGYCGVAIERWHQMTGREPKLLE